MSKIKLPALCQSRVVWVSLAAALALVAAAALSANRVSAAARLLAKGEGDLLLARVADAVHFLEDRPTRADLDAIVAQNRGDGLISISIDFGATAVSSTWGSKESPRRLSRRLPPPRSGEPLPRPLTQRATANSPWRTLSERPAHRPIDRPPHEGPLHESPPHDEPPPGAPGVRPPGPLPPEVTIGFAGSIAASAEAQARLQVLFALLAALGIVGLGVLFARADQRRNRLLLELGEQRLLASLGEMSALLAHEIRNPLGALKGHAQLLVEELADERRDRSRAERLVSESARLESVVSKLLTFVRSGELSPTWTAVLPLVNDAIARVRDTSENAVISLENRAVVATDLGAHLDSGRFGLALENLLQNAAAACSGTVLIRVDNRRRAGASWLTIVVEDDGPGVDSEIEERLFKPYVTTKSKGAGLGLALSARIVEAHGGTLALVPPSALSGAAFEIAIPQGTPAHADTPRRRG